MSSTTWLTTADAEDKYGFPAKTFASWCRDGKITGARKGGGEWLMPQNGISSYLQANPQFRPTERSISAQVPQRLWQTLAVIVLIIDLVANIYAVRDIIRGGDHTLLWITAGVLSAGLFASALIVLLSKRRRFARWDEDTPIYKLVPRFPSRRLRALAGAAFVLMPTFIILAIVGYNLWRVIPPRQTVVLVADFLTPDGQDPNDITEKLVKGMRDTLTNHPNIQVKRLNQPITEEQGSEQARTIGNRPKHKAAFVIWGDYVLNPDPELYVHFEILRQTETYLGASTYEQYSPVQIQQPSMFDFKLELGPYLGQLTAFASGLALFDAGRNIDATSLFDTAAQSLGQRLAAKWERAIRFYRGANFLALDRALDAKPDLVALAPDPKSNIQDLDGIALAALGNLGVVAYQQGDYEAAKAYMEQSLAVEGQLGNTLGVAKALGNLGLVAQDQGDYEAAKAYMQEALVLDRKLGNLSGEATGLSNLGLVAFDQGNYEAAKAYMDQALALHHQLHDLQGEAAVLDNLGLVALDQGDYKMAKGYHEQSLGLYLQLGNPLGEAKALGNLGLVAWQQGDYKAARRYHEQSLILDRQLGNPLGEAAGLSNLGLVALDQGDYEAAKAYHEQALVLHRQLGNPLGEAAGLGNLGLLALSQGDYEAAEAYLEQALVLHRQLSNPQGEATSLGNLGLVARQRGDHQAAKGYLEQALVLYRQLGEPLGEANQLGNLGVVALDQGDYEAAKGYLEQALILHHQVSNPLGEAADLGSLGRLAQEIGDYEAAKAYHEKALVLHRLLGNPSGEAIDLGNLGTLEEQQGDLEAAKGYLEQALAIERQLGNPLGEANQLGNLGVVAIDQGDYEAAKTYLEQSAHLYHQLGLTVPPAFQFALDSLPTP